MNNIVSRQFDKAAGVETKYVPAGGGVKAMQFVLGGQVQAGFNNLSDAFRNRERLKILAVADLQRSDFLPDVPTLKESGVDVDDSSVNFRGIMARRVLRLITSSSSPFSVPLGVSRYIGTRRNRRSARSHLKGLSPIRPPPILA